LIDLFELLADQDDAGLGPTGVVFDFIAKVVSTHHGAVEIQDENIR